jgi:hypothetical protein
MKQVADNAGKPFASAALVFIRDYLRKHGETSGEDLTTACCEAGIKPHDLRAFGSVFMALKKDGIIEVCGTCIRKRGHGTSGGSIYRITKL